MKITKHRKKYSVPVESIVTANYLIDANSRDEAAIIVGNEMKVSMERQLRNHIPLACIQDIKGYTKINKSKIKKVSEE